MRVRQLIQERNENAREKAFEKIKREEAKEKKADFQKLDFTRVDHYTKTQQKYKTQDNVAHKAGRDH